jgi:formate hydrogenlyase transcriptional activator
MIDGWKAKVPTRDAPAGWQCQWAGTLPWAGCARRHIVAALEGTNWVVAGPNGAAARLGIKRSTLQFRMRKLGIVRTAPQH